MKEDWEDEAYLLEGLEEKQSLQNSFVVQLKDIEYAESLVNDVRT